MKKLLFKLFFASDKVFVFENSFSEKEQTMIIHSLWRRKDDMSTQHIKEDEAMRYSCGQLARELMNVTPL